MQMLVVVFVIKVQFCATLRFISQHHVSSSLSLTLPTGTTYIKSKLETQYVLTQGSGSIVILSDTAELASAMTNVRETQALLVLSRFHEDVNWVFNSSVPTLIVNRGNHLHTASGGAVSEKMEYSNVGRESFIYLEYILSNYDTGAFPHVVGFCQADPEYFGNSQHILMDDMRNLDLLMMGQRPRQTPLNARWGAISENIEKDGFAFLGTSMKDAHFGEDSRFKELDQLFKTIMPQCDLSAQQFVPGGCIAVTRAQILSNSKDWYEKVIHNVDHENAPLVGYTVERSWACIFTEPGHQCHC